MHSWKGGVHTPRIRMFAREVGCCLFSHALTRTSFSSWVNPKPSILNPAQPCAAPVAALLGDCLGQLLTLFEKALWERVTTVTR